MAYAGSYSATDLPTIIFDFVGTVFVVLVDNAVVLVSLIILAIVLELTTGIISKGFGVVRGMKK